MLQEHPQGTVRFRVSQHPQGTVRFRVSQHPRRAQGDAPHRPRTGGHRVPQHRPRTGGHRVSQHRPRTGGHRVSQHPVYRRTMAGCRTQARLLASVVIVLAVIRQVSSQVVQAENVTVMEGKTAEIACRLHNYDGSIVVIQNPNRQTLFFNGTRALKDERFKLVSFTYQQLRIALSDIRVSDEGGYYCQLYSEDTHHQVAVVTVLVPPKPIVEVQGELVANSLASLICTVPRSKPPAQIRWFRGKKEITGVSSRLQTGKVFEITSSVNFTVDRKDNGDIVTCEANVPSVKGMKNRIDFPLNVRFPPVVKVQTPSVHLREGDDLTLTCLVTGNPQPTEVTWSRLNDTLPKHTEQQANRLILSALSSLDNGTYLCEAANELGSSADQYVLVVHDPDTAVDAQRSVSYAVVGGVLALFLFVIICMLIVTVWFSMRQKGSYLTHEASGLDEHGEAREAFINGNESHERKKEYFI